MQFIRGSWEAADLTLSFSKDAGSVMEFEKVAASVKCWVDLSKPDNSDYVKGRPFPAWALWHLIGSPLVESNLLPFSAFKCWVLRRFGARIGKNVYWKPEVKVKFPWFLTVGDHCWIGERVWIDNLAPVSIGSHVCLSQGAYLCTGNHDWGVPNMKFSRQGIVLEDGCWVGAQTTICPGTTVGVGAVLTAGSTGSKRIPSYEIWGGSPARFVRKRERKNATTCAF